MEGETGARYRVIGKKGLNKVRNIREKRMIQSFFDVVGSKPYPQLAKMGKSSKFHRDRVNTKREGREGDIIAVLFDGGTRRWSQKSEKEIYVFMTVLVPFDRTISYS